MTCHGISTYFDRPRIRWFIWGGKTAHLEIVDGEVIISKNYRPKWSCGIEDPEVIEKSREKLETFGVRRVDESVE